MSRPFIWDLNQSVPFRVIIQERFDLEEAAFTGLKQALAAKSSI
jgi:hypothetical protein